ncbi:MAG: type 4a pilus biogenesis protein PilO [Candidatus Spechtbacterales bacterium]
MSPKSITTLVIVLFTGVILFILVWPKARTVEVLRGEILENRTDALVIEQKFETTKKAISQFDKLSRADTDMVESALPSEVDLPNLFVLVQSVIASSGLVGEDIKVIKNDDSLDIGFTLQGSYESFKQFLLEAEKSLRIFDVRTITISFDTSGTSDTFRFGVKMKTWLY